MQAALRKRLGASLARALFALVVVLLLGCCFHRDGAFFTWATHRGMLREIAVVGILACGMTPVILAGGIDLSVGSVLALASVVFSLLTIQSRISGPLAITVAVLAGTAMGAISGALVAWVRIAPFIVTLAAMVFARGLAKLASGGRKVASLDGTLPSIFDAIDARFGGEIPLVTLVFLASAAFVYVVESRLRIGRWIRAVGDNREAARLCGIPVAGVTMLTYVASGVFSAIAGVCQAAQETHGDPETGLGYELDAIAVVVLGGTSLSGGQGSVLLTIVGAITLGYVQKILSLNAFRPEVRLMLTGVILVVAVLFQRRRS